jgi:hypothetical protein
MLWTTDDGGVRRGEPVSPEEFFQGDDEARLIHDRVCHVLVANGVEVGLRTTRSQVALRVAEHPFGYLWRPRRYIRAEAAPLVLSIVLDRRVVSPRIKQVVHPSARRWLHHIELWRPDDVDAQVTTWLVEAAQQTGVR